MPKKQTTKLGDCMASLAQQNGFSDYKRIYDDAANAALKAKRPNPNVLAEGDEVTIPDPDPIVETKPTGDVHKIKVPKVDTLLRISVVDEKGAGLGTLQYELKVGADTFSGTVPADGKIEHPVSAVETAGTLALWIKREPGIDGYLIPLEIGSLEHESVNRACQARLLNLGFDCGPPTGTVEAHTREALRGFQKATSITVNGKLEAPARTQLRKSHEGA
jgi:N-acetylmuramoyl-L-alanine amidase